MEEGIITSHERKWHDDYEIQDSSSIPSTNDHFHYVPPTLGQQSEGTKIKKHLDLFLILFYYCLF